MRGVRVRIEGRVQGVYFRESTRQEAERLGVTGWVRNTPDGAVEGAFHGPEAAVDALLQWCGDGPANARVDRVAVDDAAVRPFDGFTVQR